MQISRINTITLISEIITLGTGIYIILQIDPPLRLYAVFFLIVLSISILFNNKFKKWENGLLEEGKKVLRYAIWFPRIVSITFILLLLTIPLLFSSFPEWIKKESINIMRINEKVGKCYNLEISYSGNVPTSMDDLYFHLSGSSHTLQTNASCSYVGMAVFPVLVTLIGSPNDELIFFSKLFLFISIFFLCITYFFKVLGTMFKNIIQKTKGQS